jgi:4-methyl-5(b-hydroxyethyl)-thiazole monophosphate biosynthesis
MVALLLANGFEEVEAVTPADFLRRANLDVRLLGIGGLQIEGAHGIRVAADQRIEDFNEEPEAIVLPGGMPGAENIASSEEALKLVRKTFEKGRLVAAICAAPAVALQKSGILEGKRVTCFPGFETRLRGCRFVEDRVVVDGNLVTSRGAGTAAEFAIKIVEILAGEEAAKELHERTLQKH